MRIFNKLIPGLLCGAIGGTLVATPALADKRQEQILGYRQGNMSLVAANWGPMGAMLKGDLPYSQDLVKTYAKDLAAITSINMMRGYPEGSEGGRTKAKADIWLDMEDFESKMKELQDAAAKLNDVAMSGSEADTKAAMKDVGETCKSCHKEYKSKKYLNQ